MSTANIYPISIFSKLWDFSGRATRREMAFKTAVAVCATSLVALAFGGSAAPLPFAVYPLAFCFFVTAVFVRRLHDRGQSGLWALLYFVVPPILIVSPIVTLRLSGWPNGEGMAPGDGGGIGSAILTAHIAVALAPLMVLIFFIYHVLPSQPGPNKYGPNPHEVQT